MTTTSRPVTLAWRGYTPASPAVVEASYRALAKLHHPDRAPLAQQDEANRAMKTLNEVIAALRASRSG